MLKAFTPVAVLGFSSVCGLESPKSLEIMIVLIICFGVAITSVGEAYFSITGFIFQSIGILSETARLVLTNLLMKQVKLDPLSSLYYIAPACSLLLLVLFIVFESRDFPIERLLEDNFYGVLIVNGFVAFALNVAVVLLIGNASALVLTLAGIVKDVLLVVSSVLLLGSTVTPMQYFGYSIALIGLNVHKDYKKYENNIEEWVLYQYILKIVEYCNWSNNMKYSLVPKKETEQQEMTKLKLVEEVHEDEA